MNDPYPKGKPRLLIIGHARHGKDTFAEILSEICGLTFSSSSEFVGHRCVWPAWGAERYDTFDECFADRVTPENRVVWGNLIAAWNTPDKARTARTMFEEGNDLYVGMRRIAEYEACMKEGLFNHVIWVDATLRLELEAKASNEMESRHANIIIDNNGAEEALLEQALELQKMLAEEGFRVGYHEPELTVEPEAEVEFVSTRQPEPYTSGPRQTKQRNALILAPKVFPMGKTEMDSDALADWVMFNDLEHLVHTDSPLGKMWRDMNEDDSIARMIEFGGRHCYRAWEKGRERADYIENIIEMNHGSVLEHSTINWAVQGVSRSLSLELARHRVGIALSQESQRYVDASDINFVVPPILLAIAGLNSDVMTQFHRDNLKMLERYVNLQEGIVQRLGDLTDSGSIKADTMAKKRANEAARALLPNDTETRFLWTTNMRLLLHFLWLRGGMGADLEIRRLAVTLLGHAQEIAPEIFGSMTTKMVDGCYGVPIIVAAD